MIVAAFCVSVSNIESVLFLIVSQETSAASSPVASVGHRRELESLSGIFKEDILKVGEELSKCMVSFFTIKFPASEDGCIFWDVALRSPVGINGCFKAAVRRVMKAVKSSDFTVENSRRESSS